MAQIITAPSEEKALYHSVFLAGGITDCDNWQEEVIDKLDSIPDLTIFNPRRNKTKRDFVCEGWIDPYEQIGWEFDRLEKADIFSMYFCNSESVQPICLYELGRNVLRMQNRFPSDWWERVIIDIEDGYKRSTDVIVQMRLCAFGLPIYADANVELHAQRIQGQLDRLYGLKKIVKKPERPGGGWTGWAQ